MPPGFASDTPKGCRHPMNPCLRVSASEMICIVSSGALNSTHSLTYLTHNRSVDAAREIINKLTSLPYYFTQYNLYLAMLRHNEAVLR